jgi:hypothetical protein
MEQSTQPACSEELQQQRTLQRRQQESPAATFDKFPPCSDHDTLVIEYIDAGIAMAQAEADLAAQAQVAAAAAAAATAASSAVAAASSSSA